MSMVVVWLYQKAFQPIYINMIQYFLNSFVGGGGGGGGDSGGDSGGGGGDGGGVCG